jgi:hypothetical protein
MDGYVRNTHLAQLLQGLRDEVQRWAIKEMRGPGGKSEPRLSYEDFLEHGMDDFVVILLACLHNINSRLEAVETKLGINPTKAR